MTAPSKRLIWTGLEGLRNKFMFSDFEDGVYAIIGPFENFTTEGEFQDELTSLCRKHNLKNGHLSKVKFNQLERKARARKEAGKP